MACPKCAGRERRLLAPNFFECTSRVAVAARQPVRDARYPGGFAVVDETRYVTCGHRYREEVRMEGDAPLCTCGMFAIGRCADCEAPVCGEFDCSERLGGKFLCKACANARRQAEQRARWVREAPQREAEEARRAALLANFNDQREAYAAQCATFKARVATVLDEDERLVVAVAHTFDGAKPGPSCTNPEVLAELFPRLWPTTDRVKLGAKTQPWDSWQLAGWFARRALARGVPFAHSGRGGELWWTSRRMKPRKGWVFPSAEIHSFPSYQEKPDVHLAVFVSKEGDLYRRVFSVEKPATGGSLHGGALTKMAALLGLHEEALALPPPPKPPNEIKPDLEEAERSASVTPDQRANLVAAARALPAAKAGDPPTPARVAVIDQLVTDGHLTRTEAEVFRSDDHVSDAAWALVRQL